ncbi:transmembrane protein 272-like isoform X2 [Littorina saxatilis]
MDPEKPDAYTAGSRKGPPPSYDSLFGKVKAMKEESTGNVEFVKNVVFLLIGSVGFTIFLGLILAIPIAMLVMGAMHLNDCPQERYIPIYLLVAGCFGVVRTLISIGLRCCRNSDEDSEGEQSHKPNSFLSVIDCFLSAWFIAGNVWVYRTQGDFSEDPDAPNYCDPTFYWFAFWITTSTYIVLASCCCCFCCCSLLVACFAG